MDKNLHQIAKAPMIALIEKKNIVENKMKRAFALLLMLLMLAPEAANAQNRTIVTIGVGTYTHNFPLPGFYAYHYSVYLYTPSAAPALDFDCDISSIAFNVSTNSTKTGARMYIWVKDVDADYALAEATTFSQYTAGATQVYENDDFSSTLGWNTFAFTSDFSHEGGKALLVAVYGVGCSDIGGCQRRCYYTTASNTFWSKHADLNDPGTNVSGSVDERRADIQLNLTYTGCLSPSGLAVSNITDNSATLNWTETGEATAWQICVNDDEENLIDADTNPYTLTGLTPETEYTVKVRANCGSEQSAWSNGLTFTTPCGAFALPYSYGFEDAGDLNCWEVIATSPYTGITTANDAPEGEKVFLFYYNERNAYLASPVFSGTEQGLDVAFQYMNSSTTTNYTEQFQVGYTTDAGAAPADFTYGETIYGENHWVTYENTFPPNTKRIAIKYIYTDGVYLRLDDFNFESASCPRPADLTAGTLGPHSVELSWTETGEATAWQICVNDDEENLIDADTNPYTLTGLTPETEYTVKVRANCGSEQSAWSNGLTFTTPCGAFALPYSYGFEDAGDLVCWEVIATSPNTGIATVGDAPEGSKVFRFHYSEQNAYLASPVFSGTEQGLDVAFQYMNYSTTTPHIEQFQVGYTTDAGAAPADFTYGDTIYGENHWVRYENTFPPNTKRIAIRYIYTNGLYLRLDDFNFESASCPRPADLAAESITATTADLSWNGSPDTESFTVRYRTAAGMDELYTEDFESETSFANWTFISMNTANNIESGRAGRFAEAAHSGSYGFSFSSYRPKTTDEETYDQYLVSPELTVTGELSFYFKKPTPSTETLYFGYSTTTNDLEAFTWTVDLAPIESWQQYTQDLPTDVKYVAFHYFGDHQFFVYVDDIVINNPIPAGEWETVSTTEMNVTLTGLTPNTLYEAQVKGNCGEDGESKWSASAYFTTEEGITLTKDIAGYGTGAGGYYLIASPVVEAVRPTAENGFLTNEYDLYRFNPSSQGSEWENHKADNFSMENGKGYLYATQANTTLIFTGTPYNGSGEVALEYDPADSRKCWNLVGNPFPCEAYLNRDYYVLSADGSGINSNPISAETPIPPCTAVFVKALSEGDSVVFTRVAP